MEEEFWETLRIQHYLREGNTVYYLLSREELSDDRVLFRMRYTEFQRVRSLVSKELVPFPPKRCFGNLEESFLRGRKQALQVFLNQLQYIQDEKSRRDIREFFKGKLSEGERQEVENMS